LVPNISSAKKRMRQAGRRNLRNRIARSTLRTAIKKVRTASADTAEAAYREAEKLLDRAGRKGLIHRNAAARSKARLRKLVSRNG
jgi:small subunit ribosomal protein S20